MTLLIILALVALLAVGRPALATSHVDLVCQRVDRTISELIKFAPKGTGWVNRIQAWFENWYAIFGDIFFEGGGELTEVLRAVNAIDFFQHKLYAELLTILNVEGEVEAEFVEDMMPDKFDQPATYIIMLEGYRELLIEPRCRRYRIG